MSSRTRFILAIACATAVLFSNLPARDSDRPIIRDPAKEPEKNKSDQLPINCVARLGSMRFRQLTKIDQVAIAPDGKTLLTGGIRDHGLPVRLWRFPEGIFLRIPFEKEEEVSFPVFSPDGLQIAVSGGGRTVLWENLKTQEVGQGINQKQAGVRCLAFSPDGKRVVSGGNAFDPRDEGGLLLWDVAKREVVKELKALPNQHINAVAFSPDGRLLASVSGGHSHQGSACLWDVKTGKLLAKIKEDEVGMFCVAFSPNGKLLAIGGFTKTVFVWDVEGKKPLHRWETDTPVYALAFSPKGDLLAHGNLRSIDLYDPVTGKRVRRVPGLGNMIWSLAFTPDGKTLITASREQAVRLWDVASGAEINAFGHTTHVLRLACAPDGKTLHSLGADGHARIWDLATRKELHRIPVPGSGDPEGVHGFNPLALSPNGKELAIINWLQPKPVEVWDVATGKLTLNLPVAGAWHHTLAWSPDGRFLAGAGSSPTGIDVWSRETGKHLRRFGQKLGDPDQPELLSPCRGLVFLPDGKTLVGGGKDGAMHFWDPHAGKHLGEIAAGHNQSISDLVLSHDGRFLVSLGAPPNNPEKGQRFTAHVWEMTSGELVGSVGGTETRLLSAALAPDGITLATTALKDPTVRVTSLLTGKEVAQFKGHQGHALCVAFTPDGKTLASGGLDTTILLWDVRKVLTQPAAPPEAQFEQLWKDLAGPAVKAQGAVLDLAAAENKAVAFLSERVRPWPAPDEPRIRKLLANLDSRSAAVRSAAEGDLARFGKGAEAFLRAALAGKPSLDKERMLERLLSRGGLWIRNDTALRDLRTLQILERIGGPEATRLLKTLAGGAPEACLTRDAQVTLGRMSKASGR